MRSLARTGTETRRYSWPSASFTERARYPCCMRATAISPASGNNAKDCLPAWEVSPRAVVTASNSWDVPSPGPRLSRFLMSELMISAVARAAESISRSSWSRSEIRVDR